MEDMREVSLVEKESRTQQGHERLLTERAIVRVTKQLEEAMDEKGITRADLARLMGRSKGWVTQLLDGENNKTIRTVAYVFSVMGAQFDTSYSFVKPIRADKRVFVSFDVTLDSFWGDIQKIGRWTSEPKIEGAPLHFDTRVLESAIDAT